MFTKRVAHCLEGLPQTLARRAEQRFEGSARTFTKRVGHCLEDLPQTLAKRAEQSLKNASHEYFEYYHRYQFQKLDLHET